MVRLDYFTAKQFGKIKGWFTKILFYNLKFSFGVLCCDFAQTYRVNKYTLGYTQLMHSLSCLVPVSKHVSCISSIKLAQVTSCRVTQKKKTNFPPISDNKTFK